MLSFLPSGSKVVTFSGLVLASCIPAVAQLICYEGFGEYAAGAQLEDGANSFEGTGLSGGHGWSEAFNVSNAIKSLVKIEDRTSSPVNYTNGGITISGGNRALRFYDNANGSYAVRRSLGTSFLAADGRALWFSFLFRTAAVSPLANQDFFQVGFDDNPSPASGTPRFSVGANTSAASFPSPFRFFARSTAAAGASVYDESSTILPATTYLLVARIQPNGGYYDTVTLWVNPSSPEGPSVPSATVALSTGVTTLTHAFIRTVNLDLNDVQVMDELRIGLDYGSVVQSLTNALRILPADELGNPPALRWPASLSGAVLETSGTLAPDSWSTVAGPFELVGAEWHYPAPTSPGILRGFFRLRR